MLEASGDALSDTSDELSDSFLLILDGSTILTVLAFLFELGRLKDPLRLRELCLLIEAGCAPSALARSSIPSIRLISVTSRMSDNGLAMPG